MTQNLTAEEKISKAIIELQKPQPFFAHLIMRMKMRPFTPEEEVALKLTGRSATAAVDPKGKMTYSKEFINSLSDEEVKGLLAHETLHVALAHLQRLGPRNPILANVAMDVTVNMMVSRSGMKLPNGGIPVNTNDDTSEVQIDSNKYVVQKVSDKAWEEIYAELIQFLQDNDSKGKGKGGAGKTSQGFDDHSYGDSTGNELTQEEKQEWESAIAEAAAYAKQRGKLPGGMERLINELLKPKVQWQSILRKHLRPHLSPTDWSYQRPNRKSHATGVFMPVVERESVEVEVVIDTSSSIGKSELVEFMSEMLAISKASQHVKVTVNFADTKIHCRVELKNNSTSEIVSLKPVGGGGTQLENALDEIKTMRLMTPVVIVFTDGEDSYRRRAKDYPFDVVWVLTSTGIDKERMQNRVNYGLIVKMEQQ